MKYLSDAPLHQRSVTLVCSVVQSHKIDSTDKHTCCKTSDGFKVFNGHGELLFGTEEMWLIYKPPPLPTVDPPCINDETNEMATPLSNLEHDFEIDTTGIENPMSLSNTLFLEKYQRSSFTPINLEEDAHDLNLNITNKSTYPNIILDEGKFITSVVALL